MARIVLEVSQRGAKIVKRDFDNVGKSAKKSSDAVDVLRRALAAVGGVLLVRKITQSADAYTNLTNRLKLVTTESKELTAVTEELFKISQDTRNSFKATGEFYARTALAARDLGKSHKELLRFTEITNKAIATSGASSEAASNGLIQLAQGISSNRLQGDELRSVLENIPAVADSIARGLKVTRGELRELAKQGKLTGEAVIDSVLRDGKLVDEQFKLTESTIGQAITRIDNSLVKFISKFKETKGVVAGTLNLIADNFETVAKAAGVLASVILVRLIPVIGVKLAAAVGISLRQLKLLQISLFALGSGNLLKSIKALKLAFYGLNTAVKANPIFAIASLIAGAVAAVSSFKDEIVVLKEESITLGDILFGVWETLKTGVNSVKKVVENVFSIISVVVSSFGNEAKKFIIDPINSMIDSVAKFGDVFKAVFKLIGEVATNTFNFILQGMEDFINKAVRGVNATYRLFKGSEKNLLSEVDLVGEVDGLASKVADGALVLGRSIRDSLSEGLSEFSSNVFDKAKQRSVRRNSKDSVDLGKVDKTKFLLMQEEKRLEFLEKIHKGLAKETELSKLLSSEKQRLIDKNELLDAAKKEGVKLSKSEVETILDVKESIRLENAEMERLQTLLEEIRGPQENFTQQITDLNMLLHNGTITLGEYTEKYKELRDSQLEGATDFASGVERAFNSINADIEDVASSIENVLTDAFVGVEDALTEFVTTGKLSFSSLVDDMLKQITRLAIKQAILKPLMGLFGGIFGGSGGLGGLVSGIFGGSGAAAPAVASGLGGQNLIKAQHGAEFTVGGSGGTDSSLVAFRATPGENVEITPSGQRGGKGTTIHNVFHISTQDADSFRDSQTQSQIEQQIAVSTQRALQRNG